jgi:hypothetical protein
LRPELEFFPRQLEALQFLRDGKTNEILYGGGARGGKSWLGCSWVVMESFAKPESSWLIAREEFAKLRDTTLLTFFKTITKLGIKDKFQYNGTTHTAQNRQTGSLIFFREIKYIPSDPEYDRIGSYDLTGCFIDEAQQIKDKARSVLRGRFSVLEGMRKDGSMWHAVPKAFYSCNPAKNWIYGDFVLPAKQGRLEPDRAFVPSLATDNPFISQEYIDNLKKSDKVTRERLLYGNFEYDDSDDRLFETDDIYAAFVPNMKDQSRERFMTADVALEGADTFVVIVWQGFKAIDIQTIDKSSGSKVLSILESTAQAFGVRQANIAYDADGVGQFIGFLRSAVAFKNGSKALRDENYMNLKTQCVYRTARRFANQEYDLSALLEHRERIVSELEAHKKSRVGIDDKKLAITPKDKVKLDLGHSPDIADAIFMREVFELKTKFNAGRLSFA